MFKASVWQKRDWRKAGPLHGTSFYETPRRGMEEQIELGGGLAGVVATARSPDWYSHSVVAEP